MLETGKVALVFPGQGAQTVGMGRDLYDAFNAARSVFQQADEATGFALSRLIFEGPEEELRQTINAQPAIVTVSLACLKAVEEITGNKIAAPSFVAGHSLGEYTALAVAGVLDYATTIYLARQRGRLMHEAGLKSPGSMSAVLGMPEAALIDICRETGAVIANYNSPEQLVISGTKENVARASELAKSRGAVKVVPLQVSGAFHSPLMKPAVEGLTEIIHKINFNKPSISIIANVTAQPLSTPEAIKTELLDQLCNGVKWKNSVEYMLSHGVSTFIEIGPGKVLTGLIKRIDKNVNTINISDMTSAKNFALGKAV